jgi:solute carrier family 50 (sugar transporter)
MASSSSVLEVTSSSWFLSFCRHAAPLVFLAPLPTVLQMRRERSVGDFPLLPYSTMISSTFVWTSYGIMKQETAIWFPNIVGLILGIGYFLTFSKYSPPKASTLPGSVVQHMWGTVSMIGLCLSISTIFGVQMVGNLGVALCVCLFGSPLSALRVVLQTKSARAIPLPFTLASVLNCFLWSVLGIYDMKDYAIYFPNLLGLSFGLIQVALKVVLGNGNTNPTLPLTV